MRRSGYYLADAKHVRREISHLCKIIMHYTLLITHSPILCFITRNRKNKTYGILTTAAKGCIIYKTYLTNMFYKINRRR